MESVDYVDTFITVSPDSMMDGAAAPQRRGEAPTVASATFELVAEHPYRWRSSDVIFTVWADRRDVPEAERERVRAEFYARPQACLRSSDLAKRYGWGIHSVQDGRVAIYAVGTPEYESLAAGRAPDGRRVTVRPAMRSARAAVA
jgi:hypothetical protein